MVFGSAQRGHVRLSRKAASRVASGAGALTRRLSASPRPRGNLGRGRPKADGSETRLWPIVLGLDTALRATRPAHSIPCLSSRFQTVRSLIGRPCAFIDLLSPTPAPSPAAKVGRARDTGRSTCPGRDLPPWTIPRTSRRPAARRSGRARGRFSRTRCW